MPECANCNEERNPLIRVQDMGRLMDTDGTGLDALWCLRCIYKKAVEQCGPLSQW